MDEHASSTPRRIQNTGLVAVITAVGGTVGALAGECYTIGPAFGLVAGAMTGAVLCELRSYPMMAAFTAMGLILGVLVLGVIAGPMIGAVLGLLLATGLYNIRSSNVSK